MKHLHRCYWSGAIKPPLHVLDGLQYETVMGSQAYGTAVSKTADLDIYGFSVPPPELVYPHLQGVIPGLTKKFEKFEQYEQQKVFYDGREYDFNIYHITKGMDLCLKGNPNMIDSLFTPDDCVTHIGAGGRLVREHRHIFLSKSVVYRALGFARGELRKMEKSTTIADAPRPELRAKYGYDTKAAYHLFRIIWQAQQVLQDGTLDLRKNASELKEIRLGKYTFDEALSRAVVEIAFLEDAVTADSWLQDRADVDEVHTLVYHILEEVYGSAEKARGLSK